MSWKIPGVSIFPVIPFIFIRVIQNQRISKPPGKIDDLLTQPKFLPRIRTNKSQVWGWYFWRPPPEKTNHRFYPEDPKLTKFGPPYFSSRKIPINFNQTVPYFNLKSHKLSRKVHLEINLSIEINPEIH